MVHLYSSNTTNVALSAPITSNGHIEDLKKNLIDISRSIGAGLTLQDADMNIVWVNDVLESWFGPRSALIGKKCYETYEKRTHICYNCAVRKIFDTNQDMCVRIRPGFVKADQKRFFRIFAKPVRSLEGRILYVLELVQDITEERNRFKSLKERLKFIESELSSIGKISEDFTSTFEVDKTMKKTLLVTKNLLHTDGCCAHITDEKNRSLILRSRVVTNCLDDKEHEKLVAKLSESLHGASHRHCVLKETNGKYSFLSVPMTFGKDVMGILSVYNKRPYAFNDDERLLLTTFANQSAILVGNQKLYRKLHMSYLNTIKALVSTIEAKDPYTRGHSEKVTSYALRIARALKMKKYYRRMLSYCGRLHDIGKIAVSDTILNKPGPLTNTEFVQITLHPTKGAEILKHLDFLKDGVLAIKHHHERFDGKGYPDGLKGERIPLLARILSVADAFDAMTSDRAYRQKMDFEHSTEELRRCSGAQFDPKIVDTFLSVLV